MVEKYFKQKCPRCKKKTMKLLNGCKCSKCLFQYENTYYEVDFKW